MWIRCNCVVPAGSREDLIPAWLAALEAQEEISIENLELNSGTFAGLEWVGAHLEAQSPISEPAGQRQWRSQLGARLSQALERKGPVAVSVLGDALAQKGAKLLVMDADSTLFDCEVIEKVAAHAGTEAEVAAITTAAMRGELDFTASLRHRMATLAGLPATVLDEVRNDVHFHPGAAQLVHALHQSGAKVGVVSGGFVEIVEPKAIEIGLDHWVANRFEVKDGVLSGRPAGEIVTAEAKVRSLREWAAQIGAQPQQCVAMGDGANDIPMMRVAGLGIAFCAKPAVQEAADCRLPFQNLAAAAILGGIYPRTD